MESFGTKLYAPPTQNLEAGGIGSRRPTAARSMPCIMAASARVDTVIAARNAGCGALPIELARCAKEKPALTIRRGLRFDLDFMLSACADRR
jgi:hypothetical protein